jgi:hypothetical protein
VQLHMRHVQLECPGGVSEVHLRVHTHNMGFGEKKVSERRIKQYTQPQPIHTYTHTYRVLEFFLLLSAACGLRVRQTHHVGVAYINVHTLRGVRVCMYCMSVNYITRNLHTHTHSHTHIHTQ